MVDGDLEDGDGTGTGEPNGGGANGSAEKQPLKKGQFGRVGGGERKLKRRRAAGDVFSRSKPKRYGAKVQQGKALREFVPCDHDGPCSAHHNTTSETKCSCAANDVYCEKYCAVSCVE